MNIGKVEIININENRDAIISAAGRISTTPGTADQIYAKSLENSADANGNLIKKILMSGHSSIAEHTVVNLSFNNVSVFAEQFMIEFRLASFTVKSRRYVDFSGMGYLVPENMGSEAERLYREHMEFLFGEYSRYTDMGIPREDARFVLPYSFRSNFYCTVNIRELIHIIDEMTGGRGRNYPEIVAIGGMLIDQLIEKMPCLDYILKPMKRDFVPGAYVDAAAYVERVKKVELIQSPEAPERILKAVCELDGGNEREISVKTMLAAPRRRGLEQLNFTFRFNDMSLAGITHMVRHRMQSIIVPEYVRICRFDKYIVPASIEEAGLEERYKKVFERSAKVCGELLELGIYEYDMVYLFLSGMTVPIMTTMNANELLTFFRLRTCTRAQWEIKRYADELLAILREKYPSIFCYYGPSCYVLGSCPEGRKSCGRMQEMLEKYGKTVLNERG